jgi:hypothetical protein
MLTVMPRNSFEEHVAAARDLGPSALDRRPVPLRFTSQEKLLNYCGIGCTVPSLD